MCHRISPCLQARSLKYGHGAVAKLRLKLICNFVISREGLQHRNGLGWRGEIAFLVAKGQPVFRQQKMQSRVVIAQKLAEILSSPNIAEGTMAAKF